MSVLIKGMNLPACCEECPCIKDKVCEVEYWFCGVCDEPLSYTNVSKHRPNWCPLVELPSKHGRLIDADEMKELWKGCTFEGDITCLLDPRPTVLEAEGDD